jgi:carbon-monoxide dehydrogenase small subunit
VKKVERKAVGLGTKKVTTRGNRKKGETLKTKKNVRFRVNGVPHDLKVGEQSGEVHPTHTLAHTIRETLGLKGTKVSCDHGACGTCTILMDGKAVLSCSLLTIECQEKEITTIEGLGDSKTGELDPIQQSFIDHTAFQCGFCTPGMIMSSKALLNDKPNPTEEEVKEALSGNFCRCISHYQVIDAIMDVARKVNEDHG